MTTAPGDQPHPAAPAGPDDTACPTCGQPPPPVPRLAPGPYAAMTFEQRRDAVRAEFALLDAVPPAPRPGDFRYAPAPPAPPTPSNAEPAAAMPLGDVVRLRPTTRRAKPTP